MIGQHYMFQLRKSQESPYLSRDEEGDVTNYLVMAKTKAEEKGGQTTEKKIG